MSDESQEKSKSHWDKMFDVPKAATWHSNPVVFSEICRRIADTDEHWLSWLFREKLAQKPRTLLSIGCGDGAHELQMGRLQLADHVEAFDLSEVGIARANAIAREENLNVEFYTKSFDDFIESEVGKTYDAVIFIGSLHHVKDLEGMLSKVRRVLNPNGVLIYNEFVGPCYIILPEHQVQIINKLVRSISPEFKIGPDVFWQNPTIEVVMQGDPSESVRSALIPQFLRFYFDVEWERNFGGALLHPLFSMLHSNKISDGSPESTTLVKLLISAEDLLMEHKALDNDFVIGIARPKPL